MHFSSIRSAVTSLRLKNAVFLSGVAALMVLSFYPETGPGTLGESGIENPVPLTKHNFRARTWQKNCEGRRDRLFGLRNDWGRFKNTLYDLANFGQFHFSYGRGILQGKRGYIFERDYLLNQFNWSKDPDFPSKVARENLEAAKRLQTELAKYGVTLIVNLFPNKVTQLPQRIPELWHVAEKFHPQRTDWYAVYEKTADGMGLPLINHQKFFTARQGENELWFAKTGSHWMLAMAAECVPRFLSTVGKITPYHVAPPVFDRWEADSRPLHGETDIWDLLNLMKRQQKAKPEPALYYYPVYKSRTTQTIPMSLYGDSFNGQWEWALQAAGVTDPAHYFHTHNHNLSQEESYHIVRHGGVFSLGYSLGPLPSMRMKNECEVILENLAKPRRAAGWWDAGETSWSMPHASIEFLRPKDKSGDAVLTLGYLDKMRAVSEVALSLNGKRLAVWKADSLELMERRPWKITLPREFLKTGVNTFSIDTVRAGKPVSYNINGDRRDLGVCFTLSKVELF